MAGPTEQDSAQDVEQKEARQFWGYLFKHDKTGTDKLQNLLRALHRIIGHIHEPSDSADTTPAQLAHFYRELHGNYDPLFLLTPPSSIAFIYKNLGCLHSLQPLPGLGSDPEARFSDPSVPALKIDGWIMWQTIQLLLAPDEHSAFLSQAVKKWDVKDPSTGQLFPNILPRSCFPPVPDPHMVAWYEGVSDRLKRDAEEEKRLKISPVEDTEPEVDQLPRHHHHHRHEYDRNRLLMEDRSPDLPPGALTYFRNPLYRTVSGRPGVVRRTSRRSARAPSESLLDRGKSVAATVGNVVRSVGSPHLWDGGSSSHNDRDRRRGSLPDKHHYPGESPPRDEDSSGLRIRYPASQARQRSPMSERDEWDTSDYSSSSQRAPHDEHVVRHRRSHEPDASPRDYFPAHEESGRRRSSAQEELSRRETGAPQAGFVPSQSPLFATQVGRTSAAAYYRQQRPGGRNEYSSPERGTSAASSTRLPARDEGLGIRRSDSQPQRVRTARSDASTPVGGVGGRRYPNESTWR